MSDWISAALIFIGAGFYLAGSLALIRFPDLLTRLHAITKADNLGLGLLALGLAIQAPDWLSGLKIMLIWLLILPASAAAANLIAGWAMARSDCHVVDERQQAARHD